MMRFQITCFCVLFCLMPLTTSQPCKQGYYGTDCRFQCMCEKDKCTPTGNCLPGYKCINKYFGYACHFLDRLYQAWDGPFFFLDHDDTMCNENEAVGSATLAFKKPVHFSFMHIVYKKLPISTFHIKYNITLTFRNGTGELVPCKSLHILELDDITAEFRCEQYAIEFTAITFEGPGIEHICSAYMSEGRNIALHRETSSRPFSRTETAVDGDTVLCFGTKNLPTYTSTLQWSVVFPRGFTAHKVHLINALEWDSDALTVFNLTIFAWDREEPLHTFISQTTEYFKDVSSSFPIIEDIAEIQVDVSGKLKRGFSFCELYVFGGCTTGKSGWDCADSPTPCADNLQYIDGTCFVETKEPFQLARRACIGCDGTCEPSGYCEGRCKPGYKGDKCLEGCRNCREDDPSCDRLTAECDNCQPGFYGTQCLFSCSHCGSTRTCDRTTGLCHWGCQPGYTGKMCNDACMNCAGDGSCFRRNGYCVHGCKDGFRGDVCLLACHNCAGKGACERIEGFCLEGCIEGYYGGDCSHSCGACKAGACNRSSGVCHGGCKDGYKGDRCELSCDNCLNKVCNEKDGMCLVGCKPGFAGTDCEIRCSNCNERERDCDRKTRYCLKGCKPGYFDDECNNICDTCGGDRTCDRKTGECLQGCKSGFSGMHCKELVTDEKTDVYEVVFYVFFTALVGVLTFFVVCYPYVARQMKRKVEHTQDSGTEDHEEHKSHEELSTDESDDDKLDP